ncbi:type II toxin-antitoxin system VapC family toxin [Rhizobium sp. WL3]|uniref:type II toxin-antitoxin system VapC family toxin n=1 Tax=Rhizobium sp. WL3 TaxID=2603277 RepID=UPI0011C1DE35|nr:type II toxin-antitoxin system VapC family toxin [Rhizobium sp. WL3]QEE47074.1 type II toxin-antitoxin system VapC family toxin [Rhizobium sp. WL3]
MLFIDASVAVAIITREDDAFALMAQLEREGGPFYVSAIMRLKATLSVARRLAGRDNPATAEMFARARSLVGQFIADLEAREIDVSGDVGAQALDAAQRFGKIVNHPARLNLGDCFSYACASASKSRIAYKGDDFVHTDLGW